MHDRLLGIDYGDVRIGVAVSDALGITAQPVGTIQNSPNAIQEIIAIIQQKKVVRCIVGLPKDQHGNDSKKAHDVREFVKALQTKIDIDVEWVDERFSTVAATRQLHQVNLNSKKQRHVIDTQSAMFILQGVLDRKGGS